LTIPGTRHLKALITTDCAQVLYDRRAYRL
jgi:hypothetical protein